MNDLHCKLASFQSKASQFSSPSSVSGQLISPKPGEDTRSDADQNGSMDESVDISGPVPSPRPELSLPLNRIEAKAPLTNPLAFHTTNWVPGPKGKPVFMGTSSS